jgi:hypothetical protein
MLRLRGIPPLFGFSQRRQNQLNRRHRRQPFRLRLINAAARHALGTKSY